MFLNRDVRGLESQQVCFLSIIHYDWIVYGIGMHDLQRVDEAPPLPLLHLTPMLLACLRNLKKIKQEGKYSLNFLLSMLKCALGISGFQFGSQL
jgi:hypothetical protein